MTILNEEFYDEVKYQVGQKVRISVDDVPEYSLNDYIGVITAIKTKHVHTKEGTCVKWDLLEDDENHTVANTRVDAAGLMLLKLLEESALPMPVRTGDL